MAKSIPRVFVGSSSESLRLAQAVQTNLEHGAEVRIWNQDLFQVGNSSLEDLVKLTAEFDFAVFLWSSDDKLTSRDETHLTARDNVILESGMFYSVLGRERVFLIMPVIEKIKVPSDLIGISHLTFREPSDGNYRAALGPASRTIQERIDTLGFRHEHSSQDTSAYIPSIFRNIREAWPAMKMDCWQASTIAILGNRGLSAFGTDQSLVSLAEGDRFSNLRKLRIVLLGTEARWLHQGFLQLRAYESLEVFRKELKANHEIIESGMTKLSKRLGDTKSGIRYHHGEPKFGIVITDRVAYVNTYAEQPSTQVVDLPIYRFEKRPGSLYGAFKRHFDDLWHNKSVPGTFQKEHFDFETSAGGILIAEQGQKKYVALLRRHDGYWVLPKGHRMITDSNLEQTATREVAEETGLSLTDFHVEKPVGYYTYDETAEKFNVKKVVHLFLMRCASGHMPTLQPPEFAEGKWWEVTTTLPEMLYTYQKRYLEEVLQVETSL